MFMHVCYACTVHVCYVYFIAHTLLLINFASLSDMNLPAPKRVCIDKKREKVNSQFSKEVLCHLEEQKDADPEDDFDYMYENEDVCDNATMDDEMNTLSETPLCISQQKIGQTTCTSAPTCTSIETSQPFYGTHHYTSPISPLNSSSPFSSLAPNVTCNLTSPISPSSATPPSQNLDKPMDIASPMSWLAPKQYPNYNQGIFPYFPPPPPHVMVSRCTVYKCDCLSIL